MNNFNEIFIAVVNSRPRVRPLPGARNRNLSRSLSVEKLSRELRDVIARGSLDTLRMSLKQEQLRAAEDIVNDSARDRRVILPRDTDVQMHFDTRSISSLRLGVLSKYPGKLTNRSARGEKFLVQIAIEFCNRGTDRHAAVIDYPFTSSALFIFQELKRAVKTFVVPAEMYCIFFQKNGLCCAPSTPAPQRKWREEFI